MGETGPVGQAFGAAKAARHGRPAPARTAVALGVATLALTVLYIPLAWPAGDVSDGWDVLLALVAFAVPGVVVAQRQPGNPIGWILIGLGVLGAFYTDAARYSVFDYHFHHGALPFGPAAAVVAQALWGTGQFYLLPLIILLFPDGRLTRRWRIVLWAYVAVSGLLIIGLLGVVAGTMAGHPVSVGGNGEPVRALSGPAVLTVASRALTITLPVFWVSFVVRQVRSWRAVRRAGEAGAERRQQLKWLMSGSVVTVLGLAGIFGFGFSSNPVVFALDVVSFFATFALPVAISIAILRYRLYEIDRIISRTLAYAIVTGLLVGVYAGLVLLATQGLRVHTPVAVAAATLAAAALFNPLRRRVQRAVDRRFNRARYDADQTVAAFAARLKDATDLDSVRDDLARVVNGALEPAHVWIWTGSARN
ncbi:MAG TPA: hypothetical protein VMA97_03680 [Streptosporangiaceae bacterium]|nr:hypothetical protein [Streptosporangiaceae bacterium]